MASEQFSFNGQDLKSIGIGALINLGGTALLAVGMFLMTASFTAADISKLGLLLIGNAGAVIVNTVRKFIIESK